jgi:hypothetical protein
MGAIRILAALACLCAVAVAGGAGAEEAELPAFEGWYDGAEGIYYDLGSNSAQVGDEAVAVAPVWRLIYGFDETGEPRFIDGQGGIFDTQPGDPDYTDLWAVYFVIAPEDYVAGSITSIAAIEASGYEIIETGMLRNCPIVPEGTALARGGELQRGWSDGDEVSYFDFGESTDAITPVWLPVYGIDDDGAPQLVDGQYAIFDAEPGDDGYTAFHRIDYVIVPEDYEPNALSSAEQVLASGYPIRASNTVVNYPITEIEDEQGHAEPPASASGGYRGGAGGGSNGLLAFVIVFMLGGGLATASAFSLSRRAR